MNDKEFMSYIESVSVKIDEETVKEVILGAALLMLGNYLVSLALTGDHETISKLLEEHLLVLNADEQASVLTRLVLNALLGPGGGLSGELEGKLSVNPEELINAFETDMDIEFLPALRVALGIAKPEDGIKLCEEFDFDNEDCVDSVLAVKGDSAAVERLREWLIKRSHPLILEEGFDVESLINEFKGLVDGLDGKSLVQLIAPDDSMVQLALMLYALINGNKELARAHALFGALKAFNSEALEAIAALDSNDDKLLTRLFLETYRACCDPNNDEFRRAIIELFLYHVFSLEA
jgi:hypothetical protein